MLLLFLSLVGWLLYSRTTCSTCQFLPRSTALFASRFGPPPSSSHSLMALHRLQAAAREEHSRNDELVELQMFSRSLLLQKAVSSVFMGRDSIASLVDAVQFSLYLLYCQYYISLNNLDEDREYIYDMIMVITSGSKNI